MDSVLELVAGSYEQILFGYQVQRGEKVLGCVIHTCAYVSGHTDSYECWMPCFFRRQISPRASVFIHNLVV